ncbi:MAG: hypothetical protein ACI9EF_002772 [Pseudohongiellaceae bacterium]|jgi:hypothetical protein
MFTAIAMPAVGKTSRWKSPLPLLSGLLALVVGAPANLAQTAEPLPLQGELATALAGLDEDVRVYNDHVVTLASPFMEGRVPGSRGMEIATEYVEFWLRDAGLQPPFPSTADELGLSYRQPFELASIPELLSFAMVMPGAARELVPGTDFTALALGGSGTVTGPLAFVGYSIDNGPDGYDSFGPEDDLTGKIAVMLRFEPMDEKGQSLWTGRGPWSGRASFANKFRAVKARNPAAVILINTPGASDSRVSELLSVSGGGGQIIDGPVLMLNGDAGAELIDSLGGDFPSLMELREVADFRGGVIDLGVEVTVSADISREPLIGENVGGLLPGKGDLAQELIVIGAHLDHLGMGLFGSRSGPGELHPGADDNASGSSAVIMLAEDMAADYAALPEGSHARSVLFLCFSGEESGLNGARAYVNKPIRALKDHGLMINFDMIGRIVNKRLSVSGTSTAVGMKDWLAPYFADSPLEIVQPANMSGASDHSAFVAQDVPVLFGIIADFHDDYHTPRDVSWKINRVDAVHTINLFHAIGMEAATRPEPFVFSSPSALNRLAGALLSSESSARQAQPEVPELGAISVRMGVVPEQQQGELGGVLVGSVSEGTSAHEAGVLPGDRFMTWNGEPIMGVMSWMGQLATHKPGDKVQVGLTRESETLVLWVTLKARPAQGG